MYAPFLPTQREQVKAAVELHMQVCCPQISTCMQEPRHTNTGGRPAAPCAAAGGRARARARVCVRVCACVCARVWWWWWVGGSFQRTHGLCTGSPACLRRVFVPRAPKAFNCTQTQRGSFRNLLWDESVGDAIASLIIQDDTGLAQVRTPACAGVTGVLHCGCTKHAGVTGVLACAGVCWRAGHAALWVY